jgi:hypothetical protein
MKDNPFASLAAGGDGGGWLSTRKDEIDVRRSKAIAEEARRAKRIGGGGGGRGGGGGGERRPSRGGRSPGGGGGGRRDGAGGGGGEEEEVAWDSEIEDEDSDYGGGRGMRGKGGKVAMTKEKRTMMTKTTTNRMKTSLNGGEDHKLTKAITTMMSTTMTTKKSGRNVDRRSYAEPQKTSSPGGINHGKRRTEGRRVKNDATSTSAFDPNDYVEDDDEARAISEAIRVT